jgi:hypothetical protein
VYLQGAREQIMASAEAATRTLESIPCRIVERALTKTGTLESVTDHDLRLELISDLGVSPDL